MNVPLRMAVVGVGRIGVFHARHIQELGRETGQCELVAVADSHQETAAQVAALLQSDQETEIHAFKGASDLAESGVVEAAMIASRTENHASDAIALVDTGVHVLLEKPLANSVEAAEEFVNHINSGIQRHRLMLAFMRRFDGPLTAAKTLLDKGTIGRPFKYVSILEDPIPPPQGYYSPGLLTDMSVHNIDEILWLHGDRPHASAALGSNLYNHTISPVEEDLDDAFLQMWFADQVIGQIQVSRNHVAGYRNETWIYGDEGHIHVGHFQGNPSLVTVNAYEPKGPTQQSDFNLRNYGNDVPVFITRFGEAYKAELAYFVSQCLAEKPYSVTHEDGLIAQKIAAAGAQVIRTDQEAATISY